MKLCFHRLDIAKSGTLLM